MKQVARVECEWNDQLPLRRYGHLQRQVYGGHGLARHCVHWNKAG